MDRRDFLRVGVRGALASVAVVSTGGESWARTALPGDIWQWSAAGMAAQIRQGTVCYVVEHASLPQIREVQDVWMSIAMTDVRMGMLSAVDKVGDDAIRSAVHSMLDDAPVLDLNGYMQAISRRDALRRKWSVFLAPIPVDPDADFLPVAVPMRA